MNKQLMSISERDKKLLTLMVFLIVAFLSYYFVLNPALTGRTALKEAYRQAEAEYNRVETLVSSLPELRKEKTAKLNEVQEKYKSFFYDINEARILYKLDTTMAQAGFPVEAVSFTSSVASELAVEAVDYQPLVYPLYLNAARTNPDLFVPEAGEKTDQPKSGSGNNGIVPSDAVAYTDVTLGFSAASYEGIYNFINNLEGLDRSIVVKNVEIEKSETSSLQGQLVLGIYSMAKPNKSDSRDLQFDNVLPKGKANPFQ